MEQTFPDGAHYRIEVSGIETAEILEAVVDEAKKMGIPIHRAIATVAGSSHYSDEQLRDLAKVAKDNSIEVIICPGSLARAILDDPNRILSGFNWKSEEETRSYINEVLRCVRLGFRGFLVWRLAMLHYLHQCRIFRALEIPSNIIFKLSTFANNNSMGDFRLARLLGADTVNSANNLDLATLFSIRQTTDVIIDMHMTFWNTVFVQNGKGALELNAQPYDRINDASEIVCVCSPVYFKFEKGTPGLGVYDVPRKGWSFEDLANHKRKDVGTAARVVEDIRQKQPKLKLSDWGPADLRVPEV